MYILQENPGYLTDQRVLAQYWEAAIHHANGLSQCGAQHERIAKVSGTVLLAHAVLQRRVLDGFRWKNRVQPGFDTVLALMVSLFSWEWPPRVDALASTVGTRAFPARGRLAELVATYSRCWLGMAPTEFPWWLEFCSFDAHRHALAHPPHDLQAEEVDGRLQWVHPKFGRRPLVFDQAFADDALRLCANVVTDIVVNDPSIGANLMCWSVEKFEPWMLDGLAASPELAAYLREVANRSNARWRDKSWQSLLGERLTAARSHRQDLVARSRLVPPDELKEAPNAL